MKKGSYRWLNITCGGASGLVTGVLVMYFWLKNNLMPAMLYTYMLDQVKFVPVFGRAYGLSDRFMIDAIHYVTAFFLGVIFALLFQKLVKSIWNGIGIGFLFGIIWWILTPFYLMPFFFVISPNSQWKDLTMYELLSSLSSHIIFGLLLGLFYSFFRNLLRKWGKHG